ncbi:MAG: DUF6151 family protein [Gammaproteobacteria bacterium]|nr:DUF6151 family protein [Gammaproteobacteria bacterium]
MSFALQCHCGTLQGHVDCLETANRGICYCRDCQAFARYLGRDGDVLDERGGTEVLQMLPKHVHFTAGLEELACVRLTGKGLLRWYARCCRTPVGNTPPVWRISYVGLVRDCLPEDDRSLDETAGPVRMRVHTKSAIGEPKPKSTGVATAVVRITGTLARAWLNGSFKQTPFFKAAGIPVARPEVLGPETLQKLKYPERGPAG